MKHGTCSNHSGTRKFIKSDVNAGVSEVFPETTQDSEDLFFGHHEGKLETFAKIFAAASLETLHEDPSVRALQSLRQQAVWKLLSEIFRTAPDSYHSVTHTFVIHQS